MTVKNAKKQTLNDNEMMNAAEGLCNRMSRAAPAKKYILKASGDLSSKTKSLDFKVFHVELQVKILINQNLTLVWTPTPYEG